MSFGPMAPRKRNYDLVLRVFLHEQKFLYHKWWMYIYIVCLDVYVDVYFLITEFRPFQSKFIFMFLCFFATAVC